MNILAARRYVSPRTRPLSLQEQETRRLAYLPNNVTTSGHTLQAAHDALGFGIGLVFADAADRRTQIQATLF
jgi:hypothetical protein